MDFLIPMVVNYYYYAFTTISIPVNILLIFLILFKSPDSFQSYRFLLLNTAVNETFLILFSFSLQMRVLVSSGGSVALLPYGPLYGFSLDFIFLIYNLYNVFLITTYLSLTLSMYYRFSVICYGRIEISRILNLLLFSYILPLLMLIAVLIPSRNFDIVMRNTEISYPSYNLSRNYGEYGGFYSTKTPVYLVNTTILMGIPYLMPIFILYCRRKIFKQINEVQKHLSDRTKKASLDLVRALTLQAMFPMICIIPNILYFAVSQSYHMEVEIAEFLPFPMCCLPCLVDPVLMIRYVPAYRNFVLRNKKSRRNVTTVSIVPSTHRPT